MCLPVEALYFMIYDGDYVNQGHVPVHLMCLVKVPVLERGLQLGLDPQGARSAAARSGHNALWVPNS